MKKTGLIPVFINDDNTLSVCLRDINDAISISNTTLEGTAIETAIKYAKNELGYQHSINFNIKKIHTTECEYLFYVVVDKMFEPIKNAQWMKSDDAEKIIMGYLHNEFPNIITKIKKYTSDKIKESTDADFLTSIEQIGE